MVSNPKKGRSSMNSKSLPASAPTLWTLPSEPTPTPETDSECSSDISAPGGGSRANKSSAAAESDSSTVTQSLMEPSSVSLLSAALCAATAVDTPESAEQLLPLRIAECPAAPVEPGIVDVEASTEDAPQSLQDSGLATPAHAAAPFVVREPATVAGGRTDATAAVCIGVGDAVPVEGDVVLGEALVVDLSSIPASLSSAWGQGSPTTAGRSVSACTAVEALEFPPRGTSGVVSAPNGEALVLAGVRRVDDVSHFSSVPEGGGSHSASSPAFPALAPPKPPAGLLVLEEACGGATVTTTALPLPTGDASAPELSPPKLLALPMRVLLALLLALPTRLALASHCGWAACSSTSAHALGGSAVSCCQAWADSLAPNACSVVLSSNDLRQPKVPFGGLRVLTAPMWQ
mmetsp:Transcript_4295/g.7144  ORF Transcript_4295/g.7144 Transcript_4295/m.7144 type:complete len:404 (+) Transcript_4295:437-1648(+)